MYSELRAYEWKDNFLSLYLISRNQLDNARKSIRPSEKKNSSPVHHLSSISTG